MLSHDNRRCFFLQRGGNNLVVNLEKAFGTS